MDPGLVIMITQRERKRLLWAANVAMAAAVVAVVAGAWWPLDLGAPRGAAPARTPKALPTLTPSLKDPEEYAVIYQRDLRRPLFDAPPVVATTAPAPPPPMPVRLTGTVVEPGFSFAMFRSGTGESRMASAGEVIDGVEVVSIGDANVTVRFAGQVITLKVEKEESPK
jgi:hypothetical protein